MKYLLLLFPLAACTTSTSTSSSAANRPLFAAEVEAVVTQPDEVELLALHPYPHEASGLPTGPQDDFHSYRILMRASLEPRDQRDELLAKVKQGIRASDGTVAAWFNPRHGLRYTRGDDVVDFVICYECLSVDIHGPGPSRDGRTTVKSVGQAVTAIFQDVGLQIHPN